jgi:NitT/TauT family transport system substrate-binding protein
VGQTADAGIFIAQDRGYFREQGIETDTTVFQSAQQMVAPLAVGQLDVGGGATSAALINSVGRDVPIRIVADKGSLPPGFGFQGIVVRPSLVSSGAFQGCSSFKGYKVAITARGTAQEPSIDRALSDCGLSIADVELVTMGLPDMPAALANASIDVAVCVEPLLTSGVAQGIFSVYKRMDEISPDQQAAAILYGPELLGPQREVGQRFMIAYVKALRDHWNAFTRGTNKAEIVEILTRNTAVKDPALYERMPPTGLNPDGYVNMRSFADDVEWWTTHGYIPKPVRPEDLVDNSFVDYAIDHLGRYVAR